MTKPSIKLSKGLFYSAIQHQLFFSELRTTSLKTNVTSLRSRLSLLAHRFQSTQSPATQTSIQEESLDWMKNMTGKDDSLLKGPRGEWWWTGKKPTESVFASISSNPKYISCLPQLVLHNVTKDKLLNYFDNSWLTTDVLMSALQTEEAFYRPPYHNLRHPMIFYYGHPTSFYINKLRVAKFLDKGLDPYFEEIFEVGVDEMRWDDISTLSKDWPVVSEVNKYRRAVYNVVSTVIKEQFEKTPSLNITQDHPLWSLMMAIEHEKIHVETSSVLMRELPLHLVRRPEHFPPLHPSYRSFASPLGTNKFQPPSTQSGLKTHPENKLIHIPSTQVKLGKDADVPLFGWDNEYGTRTLTVGEFEVSKYKVTNGEYYEFVKSGGYRERKWWTEDGWAWRVYRNQKWPFFWQQTGPAGSHEYALRTIFEEIDMPWSWPVNVNYHEATAFCNWKQQQVVTSGTITPAPLRLITEAEHNAIRANSSQYGTNERKGTYANDLKYDKCSLLGSSADQNFNLKYTSESPVNAYETGNNEVTDVMGNVWEWAEDDFNPLDGFQVHPYYDDFSSPCFDGEHKMIIGGSFMSCGGAGANLFSRYHFRQHFLQHSGFRYVLPSSPEPHVKGEKVATFLGPQAQYSAVPVTSPFVVDKLKKNVTNVYETQQLLDQYIALHFGQHSSNVSATIKQHNSRPDHALNFPERSADFLSSFFKNHKNSQIRALDIGCAVGGATFKLAERFSEVVGIDYSSSFINKANELKSLPDGETIKFQVPIQGSVFRSNISAPLPSLNLRQKVKFLVGDATKLDLLKTEIGKFDGVLMANLLCRLPQPKKLLIDLPLIVKEGGIVCMISPYSWLEEYTPKSEWLQNGDSMSSEVLLKYMNTNGFEFLEERDMPLIIREHERKYQYIISHAMAFRKK